MKGNEAANSLIAFAASKDESGKRLEEHLVPKNTPFGKTSHIRKLFYGTAVFDTPTRRNMVSIGYSLWTKCLPASTAAMGYQVIVQSKKDNKHYRYLIFTEEDSCIPIFEILDACADIDAENKILMPELKNAMCRYYPKYVSAFNEKMLRLFFDELSPETYVVYRKGYEFLEGFWFEYTMSRTLNRMIGKTDGVGIRFLPE